MNKKIHCAKALAIGIVIVLLNACAGSVIIEDKFPSPAVKPLPYRIGVYYAPEFSNFAYKDPDTKIAFELGSKQTALYTTVFDSLFLQSVPVSSVNAAADTATEFDFVLQPTLQEYAFLTPAETATEFYAVSLKYQVRLFSGDGDLIGYWPFIAYGKNRTRLINKNVALGEATTTALRDAAAALVTQFRQAVEKEEWKRPEIEG